MARVGRGRRSMVLVVLAITCLWRVTAVKVHVDAGASLKERPLLSDTEKNEASESSKMNQLNQTSPTIDLHTSQIHLDKFNDLALNDVDAPNTNTNEVPIFDGGSGSMRNHPHMMPDKPSKLDMDLGSLTMTDDKEMYQIEASTMLNHTARPEAESSVCHDDVTIPCIQKDLNQFLDKLSEVDTYNITDSVQIIRSENATKAVKHDGEQPGLLERVHRYAREHEVKIRLDKNLISTRKARTFFGAFGLKKLLLPLILGAQIIKSILIALFLPSIIGSIGKIVGKGVSSFAQSSQSATAAPEENFEFKDNSDFYNEDYMTRQPVGTLPASAMYDESMLQVQKNPEIASRYSFVDPRITQANALSDRYYTRHVATHGLSKKQDFKVFHEIPTSSLLLTNYDPFYSPLLSRLDAVFSRLGHTTEGCREYAVCAMYRSPARFAPYSNLVSAQLSRELNELRKPSSDNPDVLRFFRYMKAAKDGQDGVKCEDAYASCAIAREDQSLRQNQAMLATYQDIDKLVHARKI
ncbi:uncharacterized protein Osi24 isoform X2 [Prorops nasuta]|uniref:uncharacterized protein Osi24 isoform X2 n=1 Tax=Prorops nasuta TaxID=863751 RepID=UPI0034CE02B1